MKHLLAASLLTTTAAVASAQTLPPPAGVLSLSAEAVTEVPTDCLLYTSPSPRD